MASKDTYLLGRAAFSSIRLSAQHYLWYDHLGWNLHPTISQHIKSTHTLSGATPNDATTTNPSPLMVTDVACGNGLWLIQESQSSAYPPGTQFHGFDISSLQFPSPSNTPPNTVFSTLDASHSSKIPSNYHSFFDVLHVRLAIGSIVSPSPTNFLESFLTMLKPGGYLQWDEVDPHSAQPISYSDPPLGPQACKWPGYIPRLLAQLRPQLHMPMTWVGRLADFFTEAGMIDVQDARPGPPKAAMRKYWNDNEFGVMTEIATGLGAGAEVMKELDEGWTAGEWEIAYEIRVCIGRKAIQ